MLVPRQFRREMRAQLQILFSRVSAAALLAAAPRCSRQYTCQFKTAFHLSSFLTNCVFVISWNPCFLLVFRGFWKR